MHLESENVKSVIRVLARSENALCLVDFAKCVDLPIAEVSDILDFCVQIHVFKSDVCFKWSDIGTMIYYFDHNDTAQMVAKAFDEENNGTTYD